MWIRLWFDDNGKAHQRAYTLVDPDPSTGRFGLEFAVHDGPAVAWALRAAPGDTIDATVYGSSFAPPDPLPGRFFLVGDVASVPADGDGFHWVTSEARSNRAIVRHLRKTLGVPKQRVHSMAYWSARSS